MGFQLEASNLEASDLEASDLEANRRPMIGLQSLDFNVEWNRLNTWKETGIQDALLLIVMRSESESEL